MRCSIVGAMTRRDVFAAALISPLSAAALSARPVRLGGPIYLKSDDPRELAREHRRLGYAAAYCPALTLTDAGRIRAVREAFAAEDVVIAEVGAWKNMMDPDDSTRAANMKYITERLALADQVGARCCVTIGGSYNPKVWYGPHPDNLTPRFFDATVANCRQVIDAVKPTRTRFSLEIMGWAYPDGADSYLRLIRAIDRPRAFGVHLDVCNAVNTPERFYRNGDLIRDLFAKLGPYLLSCHAKDLEWVVELNVHFKEVIPGRGQLDYGAYLTSLANAPVEAPLMMEHLSSAEQYDEAARYLRQTGKAAGVAFVHS
jgi:sugar phosphate isomerase/epimerase